MSGSELNISNTVAEVFPPTQIILVLVIAFLIFGPQNVVKLGEILHEVVARGRRKF